MVLDANKRTGLARCSFCGFEGIYNVDVISQDYYDDIAKHDTMKLSCRDIKACLDRGGNARAIY